MARKPKLAIIDAHALIHRAYHALPPMNSADGAPTNAVYGFTTMLLKMLTTLKPTHVVAAFDVKGPTFRHKEFPDYKAHRKPADDDLVVQFDVVRDVVRAFNIPIIESQGFEADDVIGTLVERIDGGVKKVVVTGDMDTLQLIDDDTVVFTLKSGMTNTISYTEELVHEKYGFGSDLVPDYKGLAGDASDNIPGVEGIGDKTARELVGQYGSIENIYKHLDEVSTRARNRLEGHKKDALFSRKLATIRRDVPIDFKLSDAELADFDASELREMFVRLGFKSLLGRIPKSSRGGAQPTLFEDKKKAKGNASRPLPDNYHLVEDEDDKKKLKGLLKKQKVIAFDTENDRLGAREYPIVGMSFAAKVGGKIEAWYVPVNRESLKEWRDILEDPKIGKTGHNLKYDLEVVRQSDINLSPIVFDTMLASYLLAPGARQHSLDVLAGEQLDHYCIPITSLIGEGKQQKAMSEVPLKDLAPYACEDADVSYRLYEVLAKKIKAEGLGRVMDELEVPLIPVLADMELAGVKVDAEELNELRQSVAGKISRREKKIWELAGREFNIRSTQQLRVVLYDYLSLPTDKIGRTQSGYSTAAAELKKLRDAHEIIPLLEQYRELTKLQSTYIETLPKLVDKETGRIHGSFNQTVAATGRLSSADPNLQNIPARTKLGQEIRAAFVAERGQRLVKADYSQLELRIVAHIAQDSKMIETFRAGEDIHTRTAAWVHGVEVEEVTSDQRRSAKALNFGVLYGMGPQSFAAQAGISLEEARSFIERYREQYSGVTEWIENTLRVAKETGFVATLLGRRRYVPELAASSPAVRAAAERAAFNFPIQGTAADILKAAMIELHALMLTKYPAAAMILSVHDELVCEVKSEAAEKLGRDMQKIMSSVMTLDVPLEVDVAVGKNWRDMDGVGNW